MNHGLIQCGTISIPLSFNVWNGIDQLNVGDIFNLTFVVFVVEDIKEAASASMVVGLERHLASCCSSASLLLYLLPLTTLSATAEQPLHFKPSIFCVAAVHVEVSNPVVVSPHIEWVVELVALRIGRPASGCAKSISSVVLPLPCLSSVPIKHRVTLCPVIVSPPLLLKFPHCVAHSLVGTQTTPEKNILT